MFVCVGAAQVPFYFINYYLSLYFLTFAGENGPDIPRLRAYMAACMVTTQVGPRTYRCCPFVCVRPVGAARH